MYFQKTFGSWTSLFKHFSSTHAMKNVMTTAHSNSLCARFSMRPLIGEPVILIPRFPRFRTGRKQTLWKLELWLYLVIGRFPFNQNFRKFRSKPEWNGSDQPENFRKRNDLAHYKSPSSSVVIERLTRIQKVMGSIPSGNQVFSLSHICDTLKITTFLKGWCILSRGGEEDICSSQQLPHS